MKPPQAQLCTSLRLDSTMTGPPTLHEGSRKRNLWSSVRHESQTGGGAHRQLCHGSGSTKARQGYYVDNFDILCKCHSFKNNLVYTEPGVAKGQLLEKVVLQSPVIGKYTKDEVAAYAEVEAWFGQIKEGMLAI
ncbi:hypothetical protein ONS96_005055 [Cadophora gregata f. sp. sojae]|nr:hypothetical protein ONS96_005055 [Cadophora gregata f. sp. sojae]